MPWSAVGLIQSVRFLFFLVLASKLGRACKVVWVFLVLPPCKTSCWLHVPSSPTPGKGGARPHSPRTHRSTHTLYTTNYTLHTTHYTLHTTHYTLHTTQYPIHNTQYLHYTHYTEENPHSLGTCGHHRSTSATATGSHRKYYAFL